MSTNENTQHHEESAEERLKRESEAAQEKLSEASEAVRGQAERAAEEARHAAEAYADEGKRYAAGNIEDFATALHKAGDALDDREQAVAARFVNEAADSLSHMARSIQSTSVDEMMDQVNTFARRHPGALILGAVLTGVALGRFAKASSDRAHARPREYATRGGTQRPAVGPANPTR